MAALSFSFVFGADAHAGRASRRTEVGAEAGHKGFVAIVETGHLAYQELDADDADHACRLCRAWCENGWAIAASAWEVKPSGALGRRVVLAIA